MEPTINYINIYNNIILPLPDRRREILERRFGLKSNQRETLQSIGKDLGITRERVRQLVNDSIKIIKQKRAQELAKVIQCLKDYFEEVGRLRAEEKILKELGKDKYQGYVYFLLHIGDEFKRFGEDEQFYPFWTIDEEVAKQARVIIENLVKKLEKKRQLFSLDELKNHLPVNLEDQILQSYLEISKIIAKSRDGKIGLSHWPEINPKGLRDKAYLVLKKEGSPLHFSEITKKINQYFPEGKKAVVESVHNELIRSPLFVLIGRGIYALTEWGYKPGTVKDIIVEILKKSKRPLTKEEIIKKVLEQRKVQENTILLNLEDKTLFRKDSKGRYYLKSQKQK